MRKLPRSAASEKFRERLVYINVLKQQMLDLEAVRKEVAEAELRYKQLRRARLNPPSGRVVWNGPQARPPGV
jgi:hypothetical protein